MRPTTVLLAVVVAMMLVVTLSVAARRSVGPSEAAEVRTVEFRIDVNEADAATLALLPGVGPVIAERIVEHREAHGPFADINAITDVKGIGAITLEKFREFAICTPVRD